LAGGLVPGGLVAGGLVAGGVYGFAVVDDRGVAAACFTVVTVGFDVATVAANPRSSAVVVGAGAGAGVVVVTRFARGNVSTKSVVVVVAWRLRVDAASFG
jgi:hypothetical protein